jgi:hypothetical protein
MRTKTLSLIAISMFAATQVSAFSLSGIFNDEPKVEAKPVVAEVAPDPEYTKIPSPELYLLNGKNVYSLYKTAYDTGMSPTYKLPDYTIADFKTKVSEFMYDKTKKPIYDRLCVVKPVKCTKDNAAFVFGKPYAAPFADYLHNSRFDCFLKDGSRVAEAKGYYDCDDISDSSVAKFIAYNKAMSRGDTSLYISTITTATESELVEFQHLVKLNWNESNYNGNTPSSRVNAIRDLARPTMQEVFVDDPRAYINERERRIEEKFRDSGLPAY